MAEANLSKSLDAIIEENRNKELSKSRPRPSGGKDRKGGRGGARKENIGSAAKRDKKRRPGGGGGGGAGGAGGGRAPMDEDEYGLAPRRQGGNQGRRRGGYAGLGVQARGVAKRQGGPKRGGEAPKFLDRMPPEFAVPGPVRVRGLPPPFKRDPDLDDKWAHDMFDFNERGAPRRPRERVPAIGTDLIVNNLAHEVSEQDIEELFGSIGPLVRHKIHYDKSGRSEGSALVSFVNPADAAKAMKQYNNLALDGQKLEITYRAPPSSGAPISVLSSGIRVTKVSNDEGGSRRGVVGNRMFQRGLREALPRSSGAPRGRGAGPGRGGSRVRSGVVKSAGDLDAELDDYMQD
mmetsp:Transcript_23927/g.52365  ORF Transcript_23927/g.52365 Transcript_23927/m.52365 type:complete len:348 (+) Transcript_23927:151-1194(+)|eukprot:CAMPEP_0202902796 /NCGR_PEP_ID=MMETSP1392-20130828/17054_1 /ASSEMBLY_ACC=CAM_ASM_000868 /TAXON_ID=225041 /ORGANISM="Chlamydomonas chlamydogama, Strain SAG 11-48b" /LENGTH=347 /DNA_ID=CAMNT_0049589603 /DNA_START=118 /DNA_END=1161 /DNA_ORIENTATION=+